MLSMITGEPGVRAPTPDSTAWKVNREIVLLLGWGVPMPLPVRSRRYDDNFWKDLIGGASGKRTKEQNLKELGF